MSNPFNSLFKKIGKEVQRIIDRLPWRQKPEPQPEPETPETPQEETPEPINYGGYGLYKPESSLWLLKRGIRAPQVLTAGEYNPDGTQVMIEVKINGKIQLTPKWFRLGGASAPYADGTQPIQDYDELYHPPSMTLGGLKMREAKVKANGNVLKCVLRDGTILSKTIIDRNIRQE